MGSNNGSVCFFLCATIATLVSSSHIFDAVFQPHESVGRALLQERMHCRINFGKLNYTLITSKCRGPTYEPTAGFADFACPIMAQLNDQKTDCAAQMFSHIDPYEKYPYGFLANT